MKKLLALMLLFSFSFTAIAQVNSNMTMKERALMLLATNPDRLVRLGLIFEIESGEIALDDDVIRVLAFMAGDGTLNRTFGTIDGRVNADIRMRAVALLGVAGGDLAREAILNALDAETDSQAKNTAMVALANMGGHSNDILTLRILNSAIRRDMATNQSSLTAILYIDAVDALMSRTEIDEETLITVLLIANGNGYSSNARTRAEQFIRSLWR
ncbi:MAG: hypothetical protein FWE37_00290 [Spirochaetaceae bacterium]|nr:hypothetical protein [Spirochaetaceae bacterium]